MSIFLFYIKRATPVDEVEGIGGDEGLIIGLHPCQGPLKLGGVIVLITVELLRAPPPCAKAPMLGLEGGVPGLKK